MKSYTKNTILGTYVPGQSNKAYHNDMKNLTFNKMS